VIPTSLTCTLASPEKQNLGGNTITGDGVAVGEGVIERALDGEEVAVGRRVIVGALVGCGVIGAVVAVFDGNSVGESFGASDGAIEYKCVGVTLLEIVGERDGAGLGGMLGRIVVGNMEGGSIGKRVGGSIGESVSGAIVF
jgi:hypothetical protein